MGCQNIPVLSMMTASWYWQPLKLQKSLPSAPLNCCTLGMLPYVGRSHTFTSGLLRNHRIRGRGFEPETQLLIIDGQPTIGRFELYLGGVAGPLRYLQSHQWPEDAV